MKLSVVIVNHNSCDILKQSLNSLSDAGKNIDYEVVIYDNVSADNPVEMLKNEFPAIQVITGDKYISNSKAYNEAVNYTSGEYVLLVSPHILCSKKTLEHSLDFMGSHTEGAALGVRMVDTKGSFLPESNRGLADPWISFFKLSGLAKFFPKSRIGDRNRKDWVEEFQTSEVDFVNGAFMLLRRSALNETGLFDERFAQFGYDIDLSYRLRLAGYKNYYFPKTYIINVDGGFKSEFSWQFVKNFYGAMTIFAVKYLFRMPELKLNGISGLPLAYEVKR